MNEHGLSDPVDFILRQPGKRVGMCKDAVEDIVKRYNKWETVQQMKNSLTNTAVVYRMWKAYLSDPCTEKKMRRCGRAIKLIIRSIGLRDDNRLHYRVRRQVAPCEVQNPSLPVVVEDCESRIPYIKKELTVPVMQLNFIEDVLRHCGKARISKYAIQGLLRFAQSLPTAGMGVAEMDGPFIHTQVEQIRHVYCLSGTVCNGVKSLLWAARTHQKFDPHAYFQSHLCQVPFKLLERYPLLWRFPVRLAKKVLGVACEIDRDHIVTAAATLAHERMSNSAKRLPSRAYRSLGNQLCTVLYYCEQIRSSVRQTYRDDLCPTGRIRSKDCLILLVARIVAYNNKNGHCKTLMRRSHASMFGSSTDILDSVLQFFRFCVRSALYEPVIKSDFLIQRRMIYLKMHELEVQNPNKYSSTYVLERGVKVEVGITDHDVEKMQSACVTYRDLSLVQLLSTTGLRAGAIQGMQIQDVSDEQTGQIRKVVAIREKNSDVRFVTPVADLRTSWDIYLRDEHPGREVSSFLYPSRRTPMKASPCLVRNVIVKLCRLCQLPRFHPHQFRAYIVTMAMAKGNRLEDVAKWMGHRQPCVTYRHYWITDEAPLDAIALMQQQRQVQLPTSEPAIVTQRPQSDIDLMQQMGILR